MPELSYTIWFSQRVGSTAICEMLKSTRVAGNPAELLNCALDESIRDLYPIDEAEELQRHLWRLGSINEVFGLKYGPWQPKFNEILETLKEFPGGRGMQSPLAIWENAFPNSHHVFLTRKDKVRLAVSWWKAIQTNEWHRKTGAPRNDRSLKYSFDAINNLYDQSIEREALILETLPNEARYLKVEYEDFEKSPVESVRSILRYLDLDDAVEIEHSGLEKLSDRVSEEWVLRFREEKERGRSV